MIQSTETVRRVVWGEDCEAWELHADPALSVKQERMPPGTREVRHYHETAQQFFFVLAGVLTLEVDGEVFQLGPQQGIAVAAGISHQAISDESGAVTFLVISSPTTKGDRFEARG